VPKILTLLGKARPCKRTSRSLPKFESYRCARKNLNFLTKVSVAYEQFHGIGRLVLENRNKGNRTVIASLDGEIRDGRHQMQVRVYFEDTDSGQIVYHANFLRFMERGRTNYLRLLGTSQHALLQEAQNDAPGFTFVVRSMTIDFLKPAVLDDVLDVVTLPQEVRGASITLLQECRRAEDLLVTARVRVAFISGGKAQRIPKALRLAMEGHK
jgi:acyl-CoA thioester hydrolase